MRRDRETRSYLPAVRRGTDWEPFSEVGSPTFGFPRLGDLFQNFFTPTYLGSNIGTTMPALDLTESDDHYRVEVDVPGYAMDQIHVQLADNVLTISGEQPEKVTESGDGKKGSDECCHIVERTRGSFSRAIRFPASVDASGVKAEMKGGVLKITVPKGQASRAQKIKITGG
jgi:HSP20 family protein